MRTLTVAVGLATALSASVAASLQGQAVPGAAQSAFCWKGQALPACRGFALFELELGLPVFSTTIPNESSDVDPEIRVFGVALEWHVGAMRNLSEAWALGGAVSLGTGAPTPLTGVRVRGRRWLRAPWSVELEAGAVHTSINEMFEAGPWWGPMFGARLNRGDDGSVFARWEGGFDQAGSDTGSNGETGFQQAVYVGASAGTNIAAAGSMAVGVFVLFATLALSSH